MDSVSPALAARSAAPSAPLLARPLTPGEASHLDRLRAWLRGDGTDAGDPAALDARWQRLLETHPADAPAPAGVAAAIGIAVGDLLVASVAEAIWMMCPGPDGATPGVLLPAAPHLPVLPVLDAHARWRVRAPRWTVEYVERAAAHLETCRPPAPTPEPVLETAAPTDPEAGADDLPVLAEADPDAATVDEEVPVDVAPVDEATVDEATVDEATVDEASLALPLTSAWTPSFDDDGSLEVPATDADTWAPTFVDHGPLRPAAAEPQASAPAAVEPASPTAPTADTETWAPVFVDHGPLRRRSVAGPTAPAPAVETTTAPAAAPVLWAPTYVEPAAAPLLAHRGGTVAAEPAVGRAAHEEAPATAAPTSGPAAADLATTQTPGRGLPVSAHSPLTPEDLPHRPSERVQDLALRALEVALDRAVRGDEGCAPFVLVREDQDIRVLDFEQSATGLAEARRAARDGGFSCAAVAWTSPADATRPHPRVVVDASAPGRPGIRVAHSFERDEQGGREVGGPQVVGQSAPVL